MKKHKIKCNKFLLILSIIVVLSLLIFAGRCVFLHNNKVDCSEIQAQRDAIFKKTGAIIGGTADELAGRCK
jgi:Fe-S-cluster containining protein